MVATETAQTRNRSQQLSPEETECPLPRTESIVRQTPQRSQGPEPTPSRGERCVTGDWQWRYADAVHSRMSANGKVSTLCIPRRSTMAKCSRSAPPSIWRWRDCALMRSWPDWQWQYSRAVRSQGSCRGKIPPRCVPGRLPMAKCSRNAFPGGNPWQVLRSMHPKSGLGRENRQFAARFARHASEMSWFWQDMRAMHPKSPANRLSGTHGVKILPGRAPFAAQAPRIMHGARILPSSDD